MKYYPLVFVLLVIGISFGCRRRPSALPLLDRPVSTSALIGRWVLSKDSLPLLSRYRYLKTNDINLFLSVNGSLVVSNFPLIDFSRSPEVKPVSGPGEWTLKQSYAVWVVEVEINNFHDKLDIRAHDEDLYLTRTLGDVDSEDVLVFVRKGSEPVKKQ
jgi:hypothetical protein